MSLKQLEEAIEKCERLCESFIHTNLRRKFVAFKKQVVCIPRKQLEDRIKFLEDSGSPKLTIVELEELLEESK